MFHSTLIFTINTLLMPNSNEFKWNMITASTMDEIYKRANKAFGNVTEDRCVYCVGSEYIEQSEM